MTDKQTDKIGESASPQADRVPSMSMYASTADYWRAMYEYREEEANALSEQIIRLRAAASPAPTLTDERIEDFISESGGSWREDVFVIQSGELWALLQQVSAAARAVLAAAPPQAQPVAWMCGEDVFLSRDEIPARMLPPINKLTPLSSLPPPEPAWQPIETAPKDGTVIDVWSAHHGGRITDVRWVNESTDADLVEPSLVQSGWKTAGASPYHRLYRATHWMPKPSPPVNAGRSIPPKETTK